jgi:hypothetical protein
MSRAIVWAMVAQVALVAVVWVRMYVARIAEMKARRISPQSVSTSVNAASAFADVAAADNFRNLFEVPVLFFAVCLLLVLTGLSDTLQATLAWVYVGLRTVHSFIHLTYNRVTHRFLVYITSTVCVFFMWALFAVALATTA